MQTNNPRTEEEMSDESPDFDAKVASVAENPEQRCPCILLLDVSGSMDGAAINQLNAGLQTFRDSIRKNELASMRVEVAIITFGKAVELKQDFITVDQFDAPILSARGQTPMGAAINLALDKLEERKQIYKQAGISYFRPWIFLITDGEPTDEWHSAATRIQAMEERKGVTFFVVGVDKANLSTLAQIAPKNRPPVKLNGLDFASMFIWLSSSLGKVSDSKIGAQVALPPTSDWTAITA
jgi:uncharacterized protein YegL